MSSRPSPRMLTMLKGLAAGQSWDAHLRGRSEHGGGTGTLYSLYRRGWVDNRSNELTPAGRAVLDQLTNPTPHHETPHEH